MGTIFKEGGNMKGRKELLEVLGINLGYVANNLLTIEWYDIVHRAYALGYADGKAEKEKQ